MAAIKQIKVDGVTYDIKAKQDIDGNDITTTYVKKDGSKVLSTEDFTTELKNKLDGVDENANNYVHPTNHSASIITEDTTHRFVTDTEKSTWSAKANTEDIPDISNLATKSELDDKISATDINTIKVLTQSDYDELPLKDGTTLYLIQEG